MTPVFINFNGEILPAGTKLVSINNRAFKYGDGLFESMRLMKGQLKFADLHADRLQRGMKALKIDGYSQMDVWFLREKIEDLSRRNKIKHGRVRLTVYRDAEGLYTPTQNKMGYCIEVQALDEPRYFLNAKGLIHGFLCEASSSNVFVWYQNHLYTPALSEGCVEGVMRQVIMETAKKINIPVTEAQINPEILYEADEVFLTNATKGIQSVMGFGVRRYFNEMSKVDQVNFQYPRNLHQPV
eukprot:gene8812-8903_t